MKSKLALWLLIGWLVSERVRKMRTYRQHSLYQYGYYDLRVEWWYWLEHRRADLWHALFRINPGLGDWYDRVMPSCYVRRKDAERAASERARHNR